MAKESRNFRLQPQTLQHLQRLAEEWGVSQARVLELLIEEAIREGKSLKVEIVSSAR